MKTKLFAIVLAFISGCRLCPAEEFVFSAALLPDNAIGSYDIIEGGERNCIKNSHVILINCTNFTSNGDWQFASNNVARTISVSEFVKFYDAIADKCKFTKDELDKKMDALSQIESGNNDFAKGKKGEVSRYQLKRSVWKAYTPLSYSMATNPQVAYQIAAKAMLDRENAFLKRNGRKPTAFETYLLWHCPARINKPTRQDAEIAQRFANLCERK